jgi:hypothetical protein
MLGFGQVDEQSLSRVLRGHHPATGETLPGLRGTRRIPGFDLAFRAPKSWRCCGHCPTPRPSGRLVTRTTPRSLRRSTISRSTPAGRGAARAGVTPCRAAGSSRRRSATARHATATHSSTPTCWSPTPSRPTTAGGGHWTRPGCTGTRTPSQTGREHTAPPQCSSIPGRPWQNAWIESFNGRLRDGLLNGWQFDSLLEAQVLTADWRIDYNTNRPHSSLHQMTPTEFATAWTTRLQPA